MPFEKVILTTFVYGQLWAVRVGPGFVDRLTNGHAPSQRAWPLRIRRYVGSIRPHGLCCTPRVRSDKWELARDWIDNVVSCHVIRTLTSHVSSKLDGRDASPWNMVSHRYPWLLYINRCCFTQRQIKAEATNGEREAGWDIQFHRS